MILPQSGGNDSRSADGRVAVHFTSVPTAALMILANLMAKPTASLQEEVRVSGGLEDIVGQVADSVDVLRSCSTRGELAAALPKMQDLELRLRILQSSIFLNKSNQVGGADGQSRLELPCRGSVVEQTNKQTNKCSSPRPRNI